MSFPDILKTRHLASTIGIRNMRAEAHDSGSAEGQCPAAPLSPTQWTGAAGEGHKGEDDADPGWGMSRVEGSGIWTLVARV